MNAEDFHCLQAHVADLEQQVLVTKAALKGAEASRIGIEDAAQKASLPVGPQLHNLLLLSDSALPLGSFAYSSGLESFLAHNKGGNNFALFQQFLELSVQAMAYTNVPYVFASFRNPLALLELDNDLDASTPCTVQRRASTAQGRAMLNVWEKAFAGTARTQFSENHEAMAALNTFATEVRAAAISSEKLPVNGHLAPIWGVAVMSLGLNLEAAGYVFLLNHAKSVISAGVRASVMGPYQAQRLLAGERLQHLVRESLERVWFLQPEDAGQRVPPMDLWNGRHELLYSRIFNS